MRIIKIASIIIMVLAVIWGCECGKPAPEPVNKNHIPKFKGESFDGEKFTERDLRGKTATLSFVNSWCVPCIDEIVSLNALKDSINSVSRNFSAFCITYESKEDFDSLLDSIELDIPIVQVDSTVFFAFKIKGIPTRLLVKNTEILYRMEGYSPQDAEDFMNKVRGVLK